MISTTPFTGWDWYRRKTSRSAHSNAVRFFSLGVYHHAGRRRAALPLSAARVTFSGRDRTARMGPFANTWELVSGYWIWKCKSLEEAISWVKRAPNPMPETSDIEVRQLYHLEDFAPPKQ